MYFVLDVAKRNHRVFALVLILNILVPPLALAALTLFLINNRDRSYQILLYGLAVPVYWIIRVQYDNYDRKREATRLGAVLVPEVKGKWPGNLDLLFRYCSLS